MTGRDVALLARTAAHLRPGQITQRARLRAQRTAMRRFPPAGRWLMAGPDPATAVGWPARFSPLDARLWRDWPESSGLLRRAASTCSGGPDADRPAQRGRHPAGRAISDTGPGRATGPQTDWMLADWEHAAAPALWRFHLHYWDWAWALATEPDRADARAWFAALWRSWQAATVRPGRGDAWLPYPAALRAWSFCGPAPGPGRGQRDRGLLHRRPVRPRRVPAPAPRNRCRRQPPDQEPQGAGRAGGVLRGRAAAGPGAGPADRAAGRAGPARRRPLRAGPRLPLSRCSPT